MENISADELNSRYACPALGFCSAVGPVRRRELRAVVDSGGVIPRGEYERCFPRATAAMKRRAKELGKESMWDVDVSRWYWENGGHNETAHSLCRVRTIRYSEATGFLTPSYLGEIESDSLVRVHGAQIVMVAEE
jgi:hypothetical protein